MTPIRVLCFDLDDTFWWVEPVLRRAEARMMGFLQREVPDFAARISPAEVMARRRAIAERVPSQAHHMTWLRTEALRELALEHGYPEGVADAAFTEFMAGRHEVDLFEDVVPALGVLGERFELATFSNGNADVHRIGLGHHFRATFNAESVGCAKPESRAFLAIARALDIDPGEMLYVGDDPLNDIEAPRRVGCRAAWLNRRGLSWPATLTSTPDWEVRDLHELAQRLLE